MITIKQLEAFYWTCKLGTFQAAAKKLGTTQSTISKRIQEFESNFEGDVFDRSRRATTVTRLGQRLLSKAEEILKLHEEIAALEGNSPQFSGTYRFGVTELAALTWMPSFLANVRLAYPSLVLEPEVDLTGALLDGLKQRRLDMVFAPQVPGTSAFTIHPLGRVRIDWMCSPGLIADDEAEDDEILTRYPVIVNGERAVRNVLMIPHLNNSNLRLNKVMVSNSMMAIAQLAKAGFGITYLPTKYFQPELTRKELRILKVKPALEEVRYVATYREADDPLHSRMAELAETAFRQNSETA